MTGFADPGVQFGLQFKTAGEAAAAGDKPARRDQAGGRRGRRARPKRRKPAAPGEVVSLDAFRKK